MVRNKEARKLKKENPNKRALDDVKILMYEAKTRNDLNEEGLAKCMGVSVSTLGDRKKFPGKTTLEEMLALMKLTGRQIKYMEVI